MADENNVKGSPPSNQPEAAAPSRKAPGREPGLEGLRAPIQSEGPDQRPYLVGGPARAGREGIALRVLNDPAARASFSRVYSGQTSRRWR